MTAEFDSYADNYEQLHQDAISISGETSLYFTQLKADLIHSYLAKHRRSIASILDYGCGTGRAYYCIARSMPHVQYYGVDPSNTSIALAQREALRIPSLSRISPIYRTMEPPSELPNADACMCAVVAHHIPPAAHKRTFASIYRSLNPGGHIFLFEHNPYNPLTRQVVRKCSLDKNAVLLKPSYAVNILRLCGFRIKTLQYYFFFPKALSFMRRIETVLQKIPLGAQYVVVGQKESAT